MKMVGMEWPAAIRRRCSSTPFTPGKLTSRIRHAVLLARPEARQAAAEANGSQAKPTESGRSTVAESTAASSSTTEIICIFVPPWLAWLRNACTLRNSKLGGEDRLAGYAAASAKSPKTYTLV